MFYTHIDDAEISNLQNITLSKSTVQDNGCVIWNQELRNGRPGWARKEGPKKTVYDLRRLFYQAMHAGEELKKDKCRCSVDVTCGNERCFASQHLKLVEPDDSWNPEKVFERLMDGSDRQEPQEDQLVGCLLWKKPKSDGYGKLCVQGVKKGVHILSLLISDNITTTPLGDDGQALLCRHKCTHKHCLEPTHLEWGTAQQNAEDRIRDKTTKIGEDNPSTVITKELAQDIKNSWRTQGHPEFMTIKDRASCFGVKSSMIHDIDNGSSWAYLPGPKAAAPSEDYRSIKKARRAVAKATRPACLSIADYSKLAKSINTKVKEISDISKDPAIKSPCQIWQGSKVRGYGKITYNYQSFATHLIIAEAAIGSPKSEGTVVRHRCGQKLCCAPDHLVIGTPKENGQDALLHGDLICKLKISDVINIRSEADISDNKGLKVLADKYGISYQYIRMICQNKAWNFEAAQI